jgi:putative hydrolase of the HAD superfamily
MKLTTIFFDLDETLYPPETGLWLAVRLKIEEYMHKRMGIPLAEISDMRTNLFTQYGTTLRGLQATRHVNTLEYLAYVHDVPLADYLKPNLPLRNMLLSLPQRKLIFTNADVAHAQRVLRVLGLEGCFERIIDVIAISPYCKPEKEAFQIALDLAGRPDPCECLFVDDSLKNIAAAHRLGFKTVLAGDQTPCPEGDACLDNLVDLPSILAEISLFS